MATSAGIGNVVASHYNNLDEKGKEQRKDSRIYNMRNFNNWIKSMLVNEYASKVKDAKRQRRQQQPQQQQQQHSYRDRHEDEAKKNLGDRDESFTVLDIGCGKGGDLLKWSKANVDHIVAVDIAKTSVEQARSRYNDMQQRNRGRHRMFTADFFAADCTKADLDSLYPDQSVTFDIVSCQFAFHYCFESIQQADRMLANVSKRLRPGGYFVGTTPDANDIVSRVRNGNSANSVYSISFESGCNPDEDIPLFGAKYNFHLEGVVDCPEFLVHFPTLVKLAEERHGLMLVARRRFENYYSQWKETPVGQPLLKRMNALEQFRRHNNHNLSGGDPRGGQYEHARKHLDNHPDLSSVDTLSKDEWEAATLYLVFAFKKLSS